MMVSLRLCAISFNESLELLYRHWFCHQEALCDIAVLCLQSVNLLYCLNSFSNNLEMKLMSHYDYIA